jgi:hypothetical protein
LGVLEMAWKRLILVLGGVVLLAGSFYAGLFVGSLQKFSFMLDVQEAEVRGSLNSSVDMLAWIQAGDIKAAVGRLEDRAEAAVTTLPQRREWEEIPAGTRHSLVVAKKYFEAYPPREPAEVFHETLRWIPDEPLDRDSCSPVVRDLLEGNLDRETPAPEAND